MTTPAPSRWHSTHIAYHDVRGQDDLLGEPDGGMPAVWRSSLHTLRDRLTELNAAPADIGTPAAALARVLRPEAAAVPYILLRCAAGEMLLHGGDASLLAEGAVLGHVGDELHRVVGGGAVQFAPPGVVAVGPRRQPCHAQGDQVERDHEVVTQVARAVGGGGGENLGELPGTDRFGSVPGMG
ncbi:hypothetical protein OIE67_38855 [Nonomuraea fuscirosea]|uniref:hypothetical protein n=1 Tax=Nonomuraea fuscirosea TaxID=1291556 RepID=UPI002DDAA81D|nr:hypothetical protein [Nonomuraea fuscirosea]WSA49985.1 hypothetical protein OIE67_38855 [Nonomuraea fuscirosea]